MSGPRDRLTLWTITEDEEAHPLKTLRPAEVPGLEEARPPEAVAPPLEPGALRLGEPLGEGGSGVVWLAVQASLGREVAVKTVRPKRDRPENRNRILHEGLVTGALSHPNVVPVHDLRTDPAGRPVLVMTRVEGEPWSSLIAHPERVRERFGSSDLEDWHGRVLLQVCQAVAHAHDRGVLHRDLKPDNVMIGRFGEVYLLDWGMALALEGRPTTGPDGLLRNLPRASAPRAVAGTPAYMAPEQADPSLPMGVACDVWLLGAILYELVLGHPPHRPDPGLVGPEAQEDALARARRGVVDLDPDLHPPMRALLARALAPRPEDRHPSVDDFRGELQRLLERRQLLLLEVEAVRLGEQLRQFLPRARSAREVHERLGMVRFAYRRVLAAWPERALARAGLDDALTAVARWHLAAGDGAAAELLVGELGSPDPDLVREVQALRDQTREGLARLRDLEDRSVGARTRLALTLAMGSLWVVAPLVELGFQLTEGLGWDFVLARLALLCAAGAGVVWWAQGTLSRSALNRQVGLALVAGPVIHFLAAVGCRAAGLTPAHVMGFASLAYCAMTVGAMPTLGRQLAPTAAAYGLGFGLSVLWPGWSALWLALANLVFVGSVVLERWASGGRAPSQR